MDDKGRTQAETAEDFNLSTAKVFRALRIHKMDPGYVDRMEEAGVPYSSIVVVAGASTGTLQRSGTEFATTPGANGELPNRDQIEAYLKREAKGAKPDRKPAYYEIPRPSNAVVAGLKLCGDGEVKAAAEEMKQILHVLEKHGAHGWEAVIAILKNLGRGDRPAA